MGKYDIRICSCGRIHMVPMEKLEKALENDKDLLLICGGCGKGTLIGADVEPDWDDPTKNCYNMYCRDFSTRKDKSITVTDFESIASKTGIEEIIYSHGVKVPMMTGQYATDYYNGMFSDRWYPDFFKIQRDGITVSEIMDFIKKYSHDRTTVNMDRFINQTSEELLTEISKIGIQGLNWKGTKWETKWNSR